METKRIYFGPAPGHKWSAHGYISFGSDGALLHFPDGSTKPCQETLQFARKAVSEGMWVQLSEPPTFPTKDKYDEAIAYLTEHPEEIYRAWHTCGTHPHGCLFEFCSPDGSNNKRADGEKCGCLTMVRGLSKIGGVAWTDALTEEIRTDERLPKSGSEITVEHLPVFAEWQRRLDREIRGGGL